MNLEINGKQVEVIIERKKIKNTYIRVKEDLKIYVSTNRFSSDSFIRDLIFKNEKSIIEMLDREYRRLEKKKKFFYLGKEYHVILCDVYKQPFFDGDNVFVRSHEDLDKFLYKNSRIVLPERLKMVYDKINNPNIPYPKVNIRKMTRKWGYCNKAKKLVMLNSELIKFSVDDIDYVIVHELCHFLHFNHSPSFWESVKKYKPDYKKNRKVLREE